MASEMVSCSPRIQSSVSGTKSTLVQMGSMSSVSPSAFSQCVWKYLLCLPLVMSDMRYSVADSEFEIECAARRTSNRIAKITHTATKPASRYAAVLYVMWVHAVVLLKKSDGDIFVSLECSPIRAHGTTMSERTFDGETCSICTDSLEGGGAVHTIECGHAYHAACIIEWFRRGADTCPNCRDVSCTHMSAPTVFARAKFLRRSSHLKKAPEALKKAVERVRKAEKQAADASNELRTFETTHREVLKRHRTLLRHRWNGRARKLKMERELGVYESAEFPIPLLMREGISFRGPDTQWD